jgi:hypothetical protein
MTICIAHEVVIMTNNNVIFIDNRHKKDLLLAQNKIENKDHHEDEYQNNSFYNR